MSASKSSLRNADDAAHPYQWRKLLVSVSYKMLGSIAEAEDLASAVLLRWLEAPPEDVKDPKAFAVRMVINRSLNRLKELKREREQYTGSWLPEPVTDPEIASRDFSIGLMRLLELLNPVERAVFILRNAFDYDFDAVGDFVGKSGENCRQILSRARKKLDAGRALPIEHTDVPALALEEVLLGFEEQDFDKVLNWLHEEVVLWSDGGGKVSAALVPVPGAEKVLTFLRNVASIPGRSIQLEIRTVNGLPGIFVFDHGNLDSVMSFEFSGQTVSELYIIRNPDKLLHLFSA